MRLLAPRDPLSTDVGRNDRSPLLSLIICRLYHVKEFIVIAIKNKVATGNDNQYETLTQMPYNFTSDIGAPVYLETNEIAEVEKYEDQNLCR